MLATEGAECNAREMSTGWGLSEASLTLAMAARRSSAIISLLVPRPDMPGGPGVGLASGRPGPEDVGLLCCCAQIHRDELLLHTQQGRDHGNRDRG